MSSAIEGSELDDVAFQQLSCPDGGLTYQRSVNASNLDDPRYWGPADGGSLDVISLQSLLLSVAPCRLGMRERPMRGS